MPATDERKSVCRLARRIRLQTRESPKDYIRRCSGRYLNQCCRKHQETDLDEGQSNSNKLVVTVNRTRVASDADGNLFKFKVWHIHDLKTSQVIFKKGAGRQAPGWLFPGGDGRRLRRSQQIKLHLQASVISDLRRQMTAFKNFTINYGMRIKVPKQKDKMTPGQQQLQSTEDASHHQQHQQQIPNIAGTIGTSDKHQHHHHNQHSQFLHGSSPHLHQFSHLQHLHNQHQHHHLPQLHPLSSSVTGGSTGLLTGGGSNGSAPSTLTSGNKLPAKTSPIGPSPFRQLLPVALCIISFATVLSVLIIYMDTTEIRHQQFRLNMSRDYDLMGVPQDNPALVKYVRDIHMKKYPMTFMRNANAPVEHLNFTNRHELTPEMAHFVSDLLGKKRFGTFFQSLTGISESMMTAPWLAETMNWGGYLVEPDPRKYFSLRKQNAFRPNVQVIHACLSPNTYPKEVTLHHDDDSEVRINSVLDEETEWFHPRVKCFPVYTLMLAVNRTSIDVMSLGCQGQELQILQTIPFDRVHVKVITIHLVHYYEEDVLIIDVDEYVQNITRFLLSKSYKLVRSFDRNFIYQYVSVNGGGGGASLSRVNSVVAPSSAASLEAASASAENKISRGAKGEVRKLGTTMAPPPAAVVVTSSVSVSVGAAELMGEGSTERGAIVLEEVSGSSSSTSSPPMVTSV